VAEENKGKNVPQFIEDIIAEIMPKAKIEGIFRLNGTGEKVNTWKRKLNKGTPFKQYC